MDHHPVLISRKSSLHLYNIQQVHHGCKLGFKARILRVSTGGLGTVHEFSDSAARYARVVVRAGVPKGPTGRNELRRLWIPFLFLVGGTIGLGGFIGTRAYKRQKEAYPSHNPFLP
ncbi:hypothetical protein LINPERHAP2_LOCUS43539 [Linum perenne]